MRKTLTFTATLALCLALPVLAGEGDKAGKKGKKQDRRAAVIAKKDTDGDGRLSVAEFGGDAEIFNLLDRDGDGFLVAGELPKPRRKRDQDSQIRPGVDSASVLKNNDKDGDGQLSAAEWPSQAKVGFERVDKNADGFIDKHELDTVFDRGQRQGKKGKQRQRPAMDPERLRKMSAGILKRYDTDKDGKLSTAEVTGQKKGRLDLTAADKNQDGFIDVLEITAAISERMSAGRDRGPKQMIERIKQLDSNGDGFIEESEFKGRKELFQRLDADQDGKVSGKELKTFAKEMGGRWNNRAADTAFRQFDADGDDKISVDEWQSKPELFQRFDVDGDGFITRNELTPRGPKNRRKKNMDLRSGKDSAHFLQKFDRNNDGQVSKAEFTHERRFKEIDANGDGILNETEIKDAMDKMHREEAYGVFERFDLNTDGKITREEYTGAAADFERMDKNNDGVLDKADGLGK